MVDLADNKSIPAAPPSVEPTPGMILRRRIFGHAGFMIGAVVLGVIVLMAIFAPLISPADPYDQELSRKLLPPIWHDSDKATWDHPLGTDLLGRDYMSRLFYGARISLLIGFAAMLISGVIGTTIGVLAGYFGGRVDMVVNFIITTRLSMPVVLVALAVVSLVGSSLTMVILVLGLLIWDRFAVVMRSATQQVRNLDFVMAAQGGRLFHAADPVFRNHAEHRQFPDRYRDHRNGPCHSARSGPVLPGARGPAAGTELGSDDCRGQGHDVLRRLADRHSGNGPVPVGARHQSARRRPARCQRAREPQLRLTT